MAASACSKEALSSLLWVSPAAQDFLNTVSQLLVFRGPCPAAALVQALRAAEDAACAGLTRDAAVRNEVAARLEAGGVGEVCDGEAAALVEAMGAVVEGMVNNVHGTAAPVLSKLASMDKMPSFKEVLSCLPEGQEPGEALQKDWLLWTTVGHVHSPELLPGPKGTIAHERLALAACAGSGPLAEFVLALHVLENVEAYVAWESSLAGSQPAAAQRLDLKGQSVMFPFDEAAAKEVSLRRVLGGILPQSTAVTIASQVSESAGVKAAVQALAETARSQAIIPMCAAPPPAKEPKGPKEPKASKESKEKSAPAEESKPASAPLESGAFGKMHRAAATQELQWHLLAYRLHPSTTLGRAAQAAGPAKSAPAAPAKGSAPAKGAATAATAPAAVAAPAVSKPQGFAGLWAPDGDALPPGHTLVSWKGVPNLDAKRFDLTWAPQGTELPPGHTNYSWEQVLSSTGCTAAVPSSASAPAAPKTAPASASAKAPAAKAPAAKAASAGAPEEGSVEADLCKLDFRCGRIRECTRVPDSDALYLLKVDVGEEKPRQVVSSLVKHYGAEELQDRQVVVYCNIKPGKMRNFESQAMVLAAVKDKHADDEKCELLSPPQGVSEGTRVMCGKLEVGSLSATQNVKHISKVWGRVQPLLTTNERCEATFGGATLTLKDGPVTASSLGGVNIC